ncbi:hypothetical protein pb186bvf_007130 [Paramecium bursaria]
MDQEYVEYEYDPAPLRQQSSIDQSGQRCLKMQDVYAQVLKQIESVMEEAYLHFDEALQALVYYKWNVKQLQENLILQEGTREKLKEEGLFGVADYLKLNKQLCYICFEEKEKIKLVQCGHSFCQQCVEDNIRYRLGIDHNVALKCPQFGCNYRLCYRFLERLSPDILEKYRSALCKQFVDQSQQMVWCIGIDCDSIFYKDLNNNNVQCSACLTKFCLRCKDDIHKPAPCDLVQRWITETKKDEANIQWIKINTKICPYCKRAVERSEGCNYMLCKPPGGCGKPFCYVCSNPWEPDHKDHFKCNKYVKNQNQQFQNDLEQQKEVLRYHYNLSRRYNFYYERFLNCDAARKKSIARLNEIKNYQNLIFEIFTFTEIQSQFLKDSVEEVIDSRGVMKWAYCIGYYLAFNDMQSSNLFNNYQEQFECMLEKLVIQLIAIFEYIDSLKNPILRQQRGQFDLQQQFENFKTKIQNFTVLCSKFKMNLIDVIEDGSINIPKQ